MPDEIVPFGSLDHIAPGKVKAIFASIRFLFGAYNPILDSRLARESREHLDAITVENAAERLPLLVAAAVRDEAWKDEPQHMRPTPMDVVARVLEYAEAQQQATHHGKRKILWNAFFSSFDPKFYRDGWATHLWSIAKQLEYPECRLLVGLIERPAKYANRPDGSEDQWLVERLIRLGLVRVNHGRVEHWATDVGVKLKEFVWEQDMWRVDGVDGVGVP